MSAEGGLAPRSFRPLPAALLRLASDRRLVEYVQAGSEPAFEALFDRHRGPVLAFCRRMLASPEEAEDAMQLTFLAAYSDLVASKSPRALRPWLYAIARHRCLMMLRARRERPSEERAEPADDRLFAEVTTREELRAILTDVGRLPDDQRTAIVLAELGGVSYDEIARVLSCPREKVKARVFQARSSLAAGHAARETPCAEIREQLATLRGGALRRASLRRHIRDCAGCRAFRDEMRSERRRLRLLHPVVAFAGLKRAVVGGVSGSGGGGAGAGLAVSVGSVSGTGLAATVLATVAIPVGAVAVAITSSRDGRTESRAVGLSVTTGAADAAGTSSPFALSGATATERAGDHSSASPLADAPVRAGLPQAGADHTGPGLPQSGADHAGAHPAADNSGAPADANHDDRTSDNPSDASKPAGSVSSGHWQPKRSDPSTPPSANDRPSPQRPTPPTPPTPPTAKRAPAPAERSRPAAPPRPAERPAPPVPAAPGRPSAPPAPKVDHPAPSQDRVVTPPAPAPAGGSPDAKPSAPGDHAPDHPEPPSARHGASSAPELSHVLHRFQEPHLRRSPTRVGRPACTPVWRVSARIAEDASKPKANRSLPSDVSRASPGSRPKTAPVRRKAARRLSPWT